MITDRAFAGADTLATSYALRRRWRKSRRVRPIDLIICGKMTIDGDTGQVGTGHRETAGYAAADIGE